ncbi:MAG: CSS-motif domain-containing protein, partial [Casimicrobium sp.]
MQISGGAVVYRLARFKYLSVFLIAMAVLAALAMSALIGWRVVNDELRSTVYRAVFNADRLVDRTVTELNKLDSLRKQPCDASTTRTLQETVYNSLSQIREVGLVRDGRLYCTNFGETPKEIPVPQHLVQPGIHVEVAPNSVIANNTSLYVYVSREAGSAVDALFNPQVLAEFERDFSYSGFGSLTLRANPGQNIARAEDDVRNTIYTIGTLRAADADGWLITERYDSQRSA